MPLVEDILALKDLGIGAVSMVIFYYFASKTRDDVIQQLRDENTRSQENQKEFLTAYKENTKALHELISEFKEHINVKNHAIGLLEEQHNQLEKRYDLLSKMTNKKHE